MRYHLISFLALCLGSLTSAKDGENSIRAALEPFVESGEISGVITLVAKNGKIISHEAIGVSDLESHLPINDPAKGLQKRR